MGDALEAPGGQALGQGELQHHATETVGSQLRVEEGGLLQVLAHLHGLSPTLLSGIGLFFLAFRHSLVGQCCRGYCARLHGLLLRGHAIDLDGHNGSIVGGFRLEHHRLFEHVHVGVGTAHHLVPDKSAARTIELTGIDIVIEVAEVETSHRQVLLRKHARAAHHIRFAELPEGVRHVQADVGIELPVHALQLVEALVVERCHELRIGRRAVGVDDGERPLLLLTRRQPVAEGLPMQPQRLVGQRPRDGGGVLIELSVLCPGEGEQQRVAIVLAIGELAIEQGVRLVDGALFNNRRAGKDGIDHVHILSRRAHLQRDGLAVVGELIV